MRIRTATSILFATLSLVHSFAYAAGGAPKAKYGPEATPLSISHDYFKTHSSEHFWKLMPYYVPQRDGAACSVATITMLANAVRATVGLKLTANDPLISQEELLKKVKHPAWKDWLTQGGRGVSLDEAGAVADECVKLMGLKAAQVEVVHTNDLSEATRKKIHQALVDSEKPNGPFILSNFIQGTYTGDANIGHFAPVGAYDPENKKVLILDPDREWYEPYWVSEETFLKGMATLDVMQLKHRGYILVSWPEHQ